MRTELCDRFGIAYPIFVFTPSEKVAAAAATQFVVTKEVTRGRTFSDLREVKGKARQEEIARMLGGKSESALRHAASLLRGEDRPAK